MESLCKPPLWQCILVYSQLKRRLEVTGMWFESRMLGIPGMEHVCNKQSLRKMEIKKSVTLRIRKLTFLGHRLRK